MVPPSRMCLQAASSEQEISRSQGTQRPITGYLTQGPSCNSSVALAATVQGEEQRVSTSPNIIPTRQLPCDAMVDVEVESQRNITEDIDHEVDVRSMAPIEVNNGPKSSNEHQANTSTDTENYAQLNINSQYSQERNTCREQTQTSQNGTGLNQTQDENQGSQSTYDDHENSWVMENRAIRKQNKPPKVIKSGKFTRSNLTMGSLNIAGCEANLSMHNKYHKFKFLKRTIDVNNLGVLGIQETHFDNESAAQFNNMYHRWLKLYYSADPKKPSSTAGVAFVLNKKLVDTDNVREYELIPGRALMIVIPWHQGESLNILNICPLTLGNGNPKF
ncbi:hypothetical protein C8R45DRAFT_931810 [Mycena sanguinolenta]|nr:hypothetical protein C8R45DRAFT_931810 [Mycena sanguinolenta]